MKKSIIITILLVYLASIILVGFFGISVKVYDVVKYVQSIEMSVESNNPDAYDWQAEEYAGTGKHRYELTVHFSEATEGPVDDGEGNIETKMFIGLNLIPQVTYTSGDLGAEEPIQYRLSDGGKSFVEEGYFTLSDYGVLMIYKELFYTTIYIEPQNYGSINAGAVIELICIP